MSVINKNSKVLILGTGLIGSAFQRLFVEKEYTNVISVNSKTVDLTNAANTLDFFKKTKPEFIINAAGKVGGIIANKENPADFITTNLSIQMNVIRAAHETGIEKMIFFGSSCMYPKSTEQPMPEEALFTGKPEQTSMAYAISKIAGMQLCLAFNQQFGINKYIPVIPNSVYGPNDNFDPSSGHVLSSLLKRFHEAKINNIKEVTLWGSGSVYREFIHADDLAKACLHLLSNNLNDINFPINIGVGEDISIKDLANRISTCVGYQGSILWDVTKPDGTKRKLLDSSKVYKTGWKPEVDFDKGIFDTLSWYIENVMPNTKN